MASRKQFMTELAKHKGAKLDEETIEFDFHVDTPRGFIWKASGSHCLTAPHRTLDQSYKTEAYADLIERMRYGLEPCTDPDCDVCKEK